MKKKSHRRLKISVEFNEILHRKGNPRAASPTGTHGHKAKTRKTITTCRTQKRTNTNTSTSSGQILNSEFINIPLKKDTPRLVIGSRTSAIYSLQHLRQQLLKYSVDK